MSIRKLKAAEAMASIRGSREAEQAARYESTRIALEAFEAEDRRYLDRQSFWRRLFLKWHRAKVELFAKQLIIKASERGVLTSQQAKSLIKSAERMLRPEDGT